MCFNVDQKKFQNVPNLLDFCLCVEYNVLSYQARDEARHGKALKGLLDRYFK